MKINYIKCKKCEDILFSFYRHDFKSCRCEESFIDGGFDYIRYNGELLTDDIKNVMSLISSFFIWGQNYNEKNERLPETIYKPLKDLTTSHISGIIRYILEKSTWNEEEQYFIQGKQIMAILLIFTYELENRLKDEMERQNIKTKRAR